MGDRVLFQVVSRHQPEAFGPVVYCHWSGEGAPQIVRRLAARMKDRANDIDYATARLVQECIADDLDPTRSTGFGVWNATHKLTAENSHGDAGVVLIDCADGFKCECLDGYLRTGADGFPEF